VPLIVEHYRRGGAVPEYFALGFAAFLVFMKPAHVLPEARGRKTDAIQDDNAAYFCEQWEKNTPEELPRMVLSDSLLWGADLAALPGFAERVTAYMLRILDEGAYSVLQRQQHALSSG
jgi:tagaturonate reductase